jgi:hypothetical protein
VRGSAPHIHQLITMLASSLPSITRANNLEFQVSVESEQDDAMAMNLSLLASSPNGDETGLSRLTALAEESALLQKTQSEESDAAFKAAWQLAYALGAKRSIEKTTEGKLRVHISLPLIASSAPVLNKKTTLV